MFKGAAKFTIFINIVLVIEATSRNVRFSLKILAFL